MTYRNCIITPDPVRGNYYTWYHPDWVYYDFEMIDIWSGYGSSVEECIAQIDEWYDRAQS
jgi:hypothetical protein